MDFKELYETQSPKSLHVTFPLLGIAADFHALPTEELYESTEMGGFRGIKYGLYLACPQLKEAGSALFAAGKLHSPEDICDLLPTADIDAVWQELLQISGGVQTAIITPSGASALVPPREEAPISPQTEPPKTTLPLLKLSQQEAGGGAALSGEAVLRGGAVGAPYGGKQAPPSRSSLGATQALPLDWEEAPQSASDPDSIAQYIVARLLALSESM